MDYPTFLRRQWQALLDQWLGVAGNSTVNTAYIALPDLSWLDKLKLPQWPGGGGSWLPLGKVALTQALVRQDGVGKPQLWVKPEDKAGATGRYAGFWHLFIELQGMPPPPSTLGGRTLAVDHLFPETAAARRGWALVRIMPVDRRSNSLVGSTIEKVEANRGGVDRPRTASSITLAKVTGFQGSFARTQGTGAVAKRLLDHIRSCGLVVPEGIIVDPAEEARLIAWLIETYRR